MLSLRLQHHVDRSPEAVLEQLNVHRVDHTEVSMDGEYVTIFSELWFGKRKGNLTEFIGTVESTEQGSTLLGKVRLRLGIEIAWWVVLGVFLVLPFIFGWIAILLAPVLLMMVRSMLGSERKRYEEVIRQLVD